MSLDEITPWDKRDVWDAKIGPVKDLLVKLCEEHEIPLIVFAQMVGSHEAVVTNCSITSRTDEVACQQFHTLSKHVREHEPCGCPRADVEGEQHTKH